MKKLPISIIIPIYNGEAFLNETIDSVLSQTFSDFEILALDDGSIDNSRDIIQSYDDSRIRYVSCSHNFINTLNYGLSISKGKYIAQIDHDDIMVPHRLQTQFEFMEINSDIAACGGYMTSFGKNIQDLTSPLECKDVFLEFFRRKKGPIQNSTGFIRKDVLLKNDIKYKEGYAFAADTKFWSDIIKVGKVVNLPEVFTLYRTSDTQTSVITIFESNKAADVIRQELFNFIITNVKDGGELKQDIQEKLLPLLSKMIDLSFFSSRNYTNFLGDIVEGLIDNGFVNLAQFNSHEE